ncbi:MAG TPA: glycosyltransferase family 2 protein [Polyangia bacterium]|jgi:glycosyltransferase involved in cell wall biosynthesis|nr:glycosyltransferase family 2 protein [Polyangia bacterium]
MINGKKVVVVMPAYNAERTLEKTVAEIPSSVDEVILVDDRSNDRTVELARELGLRTLVHPQNRGYGGNQKTCYAEALRAGADIVVMVHPDYQYTPKLVPALAHCITSGLYDVALGSRILGGRSIAGGMPRYKYVANRLLTAAENLLVREKLSEYHTGYRAFSRRLLLTLPLNENEDGFVFDNQMLVQAIYFGFRIAEITCPTAYFEEASSIGFLRSMEYGIGVMQAALECRFARMGLRRPAFLSDTGRRLTDPRQPPVHNEAPLGALRRRREDRLSTSTDEVRVAVDGAVNAALH